MEGILLFEDDERVRRMVERWLSRRGFQVTSVAHARQAVDMALTTGPAVILMDLDLPEVDGFQATRLLKADPRTSGIPVVALTAHAMPGDHNAALAAGCDGFETKPIDIDRLCATRREFAGG